MLRHVNDNVTLVDLGEMRELRRSYSRRRLRDLSGRLLGVDSTETCVGSVYSSDGHHIEERTGWRAVFIPSRDSLNLGAL